MMDVLASGDSDQEKGSVMMRELETCYHKGNTMAQGYSILSSIDKGSFGEVKLGLHIMTEMMVAIKIQKRGTKTDTLVISEVDIVKRLHHSNIIQLFQVIETRHTTYIVMEYAAWGSLQKHISIYGLLDEDEARSIFTELSLAINYIHSQNIAHRDIKAENILLDWEGHVKLADFGLSKKVAPRMKWKGFCGTAQYCAPEVFGLRPYDVFPCDIWSTGVLLYYVLIGHFPFQVTMFSEIKHEILPWSYWIPNTVSPVLQDLLHRLMTIDPTMRPSSQELLAHPWLCQDPDTLRSSEISIPLEPEPNIAFAMFLLGYNIKELRDSLRERNYSHIMATYLMLKKKQPEFHHRGPVCTLDPPNTCNHTWPKRRVTSAPSLPTSTWHTLYELPGGLRKGSKRSHSVPPTFFSLKSSFLEDTSPLQGLMPHVGKWTLREEGSINSTTSPSRKEKATRTEATTSVTMVSVFVSQASTFENRQDVSNESSEFTDASCSTSAWGSATRTPFPSEKIQEENIGNESLQENSSSSRKTDHQGHLQRQCQAVPRVPLRRWGWKGLKRRISKTLRSLCCCLPVTNNNIMPVNEEC
ncbi:sperm motility kinase X-like [Arvicanthis niloticus]|uniref:sperm motility kinase X-like n=1 Tax=Arvicanthis niloticus TaxID=61156 RepID=UPI00402B75E7